MKKAKNADGRRKMEVGRWMMEGGCWIMGA